MPGRVPADLNSLSTAAPKRRIEVVSSGVDESLQTIGSDPNGGTSWPGLRVPSQPTATLANITPTVPASKLRYLFMLASFSIGEGARARIVGIRTSWTLGLVQNPGVNPRVVEQTVRDPFFKLPDGNVSFHLRQSALSENDFAGNAEGVVGLATPPFVLPALPNLIFKNSRQPAMLFQGVTYSAPTTFYADNVLAYQPPNQGQPYGRTVTAGYGTFQDIRMQYAQGNNWGNTDLPIEGPATIQLFASVRQSNPATRPALVTPAPFLFSGGLSEEEQFLQNFPTAIIWRVAGSFAVEFDDPHEDGWFLDPEQDG